jgi:hypothetical protein
VCIKDARQITAPQEKEKLFFMPSNPANQTTTTRSTVFAFKCKMGTHLARIDFNLVLRTNEVKQLFFSEENNVHLVCMRLKDAITRTRFVNALVELERKPLANFRRPVEGVDWNTFIFSGSQLRTEGGAGSEIRETLTRHMDSHHPSFFQSHSTTARHVTHMLRNIMRGNPYRNNNNNSPSSSSAPVPVVVAPPPPPPVVVVAPSSPAETLPVLDSPSSSSSVGGTGGTGGRSWSNTSSVRTVPMAQPQQDVLFSPPLVAANGQVNMVGISMHVRETAAAAIYEILRINPDFNLQNTLGDLTARMDELLDIVTRIRQAMAARV